MEFTKLLGKYREEIDKVDLELLKLFVKRFEVVNGIGKLKKENNIPPLDERRWNEVLGKMIEKGEKYGLSKNFIKKVWSTIHEESLNIEG